MFGLSTELITKSKLATVKRFECFALTKGLRSKREHSNHFTVANLLTPLINQTFACYLYLLRVLIG